MQLEWGAKTTGMGLRHVLFDTLRGHATFQLAVVEVGNWTTCTPVLEGNAEHLNTSTKTRASVYYVLPVLPLSSSWPKRASGSFVHMSLYRALFENTDLPYTC